ncbi:MAG: glycosyltransferase family 4 protein [Desulfovermiculus sp.]|nr:glycosyltransferase family 4 protein [Desulfovermiculus sp.]
MNHNPARTPRILHILSGDLWAGAEVMTGHLLRGLHSGTDCHLLAVVLNEGQVAARLRQAGVQVVILDESQASFGRLLQQVRKTLKTFQPQIIHSHRYKENILAYLASRGRARVSLIATQHGMPESHGQKSTLKGRLLRKINSTLLSRRFNTLVAVSREMKETLVHNGLGPSKVAVIHNGIELPPWYGPRESNGHFVVGSCGRLFAVKNYRLFIEMAARVAAQSPQTGFQLAGDGPLMEDLRRKCSQYSLNGRFEFLGHVLDMPTFYQGLKVYVSTSWHEGMPMSVLEAMSHGLPIVAPDVGGFPEIVEHEKDGFLIPDHDPGLFAQACLRLQSDPALLARMSAAAREKVVSKFSVQRMTQEYHRLYQKLAG